MTLLPERFDVAVWRDHRNIPVALLYGVTVYERTLEAELGTITRKLRKSPRVLELYRNEARAGRVKVVWNDPLKPALYGSISLSKA